MKVLAGRNFSYLPKQGRKRVVLMSESLRQSLTEIRNLTPDLNKVTDEAATVVSMVEKFLSEMGVGIPTEVNAGDVHRYDLKLSYQRLAGRFRLVVAAWSTFVDEETGQEPYEKVWEKAWSDCPRAEKLKSFKALPELLEKIADDERRAVKEMGGTTETIKAVLAAIKG